MNDLQKRILAAAGRGVLPPRVVFLRRRFGGSAAGLPAGFRVVPDPFPAPAVQPFEWQDEIERRPLP